MSAINHLGQPVETNVRPHTEGIIDVTIADAMVPAFEEWLAQHQAFLALLPPDLQSEDHPDAYFIGVTEAAIKAVRG
jgi:aromatic ring-cleaving dioxygenase